MKAFVAILLALAVTAGGYWWFTEEARQMEKVRECVLNRVESMYGPVHGPRARIMTEDSLRGLPGVVPGAFESREAFRSTMGLVLEDKELKDTLGTAMFLCQPGS